jgi:hypothetical protein
MSEMAMVSYRSSSRLTEAVAMVWKPLFATVGNLLGINLVGSLVDFVFQGLAARLFRRGEVGMALAVPSAVALVLGIAALGLNRGSQVCWLNKE